MIRVKVIGDFFVEATSSHFMTGWVGEVSDEIAKRHGKSGTGLLEEVKPVPSPEKSKK